MTNSIQNGTKREVDGRLCVYYDGYWIRSYTPTTRVARLPARR